ncbi:hypothetical protein [Thalassovita sp.]|uniref:hypothetical protein n=1 Tax=Thalassovita sp. TaxID=1979401 RepID=UPI002B267BC5|nr:hypothetical protein [Thalassovita sp.]
MTDFEKSSIWQKLFVAWSVLFCTALIGFNAWTLIFHTAQDYFATALVQLGVVTFFVTWVYFTTARHVIQHSPQARKRLGILAFFWLFIFILLFVAALIPSESNDEHALVRSAIGLSTIAAITTIQFVFRRKISGPSIIQDAKSVAVKRPIGIWILCAFCVLLTSVQLLILVGALTGQPAPSPVFDAPWKMALFTLPPIGVSVWLYLATMKMSARAVWVSLLVPAAFVLWPVGLAFAFTDPANRDTVNMEAARRLILWAVILILPFLYLGWMRWKGVLT